MNEARSADIVDFSTSPPEISVSKPAPDRILSGDPVTTAKNYFSDGTGRFFAGVWESTSGRWRVTYSEHEFCHITRGRVRIEGSHGKQWEFGPGASFVVPAGFVGTWEVLEPMRKLYVVYEMEGDRG
jgi:hypothetical protein